MSATLPSPDLVDELVDTIETAAADVLGTDCPLCEAVIDTAGPLIHYLYRRLAAGKSPRADLLALLLSEADNVADEAERAKFGPEPGTKP